MLTFTTVEVDADILPKLLNVLELIVHFRDNAKVSKKTKNSKSDTFAISNIYSDIKFERTIGRHLVDPVVKAISNHRYNEVAKLFEILAQDRNVVEFLLFKIGILCFMNLELINKQDSLFKFFCSIQKFLGVNKKEVQLEFIMLELINDFPDIKRSFEELSSLKMNILTRKLEQVDSVLVAYTILLDYINWCQVSDDDNIFSSQSQMNKDKTIIELENVIKNDGNMDIFVLKLIKILDSNDKQDEVERVLLKYAESNQDSTNALIYICTYLYHSRPDSESLVKYLVILAEKSPSDLRVLWLIEVWYKKGINLFESLNCCFMFLDYPSNGKNIQAWQLLWQNLSRVKNKLTTDDIRSSYWESRRRSWTWMYFNPQNQAEIKSNSKLLTAYKTASLLLLGEGKKYTKKVSKLIPDIQELIDSLQT